MKKNIKSILFAFALAPFLVVSQGKKDSIPEKPQRPAFESSFIIDNPTNILFSKKSMEMHINHRFGLISGGNNDLAGLWAPANIRLGLTYAFFDGWTVGFGTTKFNRLQDFNTKVSLLRQTRSDKVPVNLSYYGNFVIDARPKELFDFDTDRFSYFHQLIISRRFNRNFSLQLAPSISHYNLAELGKKNDVISAALGARYKVSPQTSILVDYSQPFTNYGEGLDPKPGLSLGVEFSTSGHAFQIIVSNYNGIVPQKNYSFNQNDFFNGDILIGFNITRVYKF
ncbi:DUF5777 family beta-barrel protein [Maribacter sp. HTCC2170]|uniref:DUF5777 family beta-barrel protein n=1 Tax=Maribacter sp. (strain HTCC2170 / KCCM 42371) TaxID=313603 RepID=UPI00006B21BC|nr:DUF5777 family beta-barrel protein [Maribacter sp. HTCC2170]EAR00260.1 hypothetical protein FB2170_12601 [Maribacter sp. HTCC2170]